MLIKSFVRFYFAPSLKNWRILRRCCMKKLPPVVKAEKGEK